LFERNKKLKNSYRTRCAQDVEDPDLVEWIARQTDWYGHRQVNTDKSQIDR
jgi:hypothetical protein